jgi:aspartate carbamoyltransferase regulatory subunit
MKKTLSVSAINHGTVIDHIDAGQALKLIPLLKLNHDHYQITIGLNLTSTLMGSKDIIKINDLHLTEKEAAQIAIFAPHATLNIIDDYSVIRKIKARLPQEIRSILICPNKNCITAHETVESLFHVSSFKNKVHLHCNYCEKIFSKHEIEEYST